MYSRLKQEIEKGIAGENVGLSVTLDLEMSGFSRLSRVFTFGRGKYITLGGPGGVGKTSFVLYRFMFVPIWAYLKKMSTLRPYFIYHLTERQVVFMEAKILAMILYHAENLIYDVPTILQMGHKTRELTDKDIALFDKYGPSVDKVLEFITFHVGTATLESMAAIQQTHLKVTAGKDLTVVHVTDHVNNIVFEGGDERGTLNKHSDQMKLFRDDHKWLCIDISQFSREIENDYRTLKTGVRVKKSDWFGSSKFQMNCDLMLGLIDPRDYDVSRYPCKESGDKQYFELKETTNDWGYNRFRALWIAKNNDGAHGIYIPLAFAGECGVSSELPKSMDLKTYNYEKIRNGMFL